MVPKRHTRCTAHTLSARTRRRAHPREIPRRPRLAGWLAGVSTMDWVTVAPSAGILTTLLCCPALHSTLYHHVPLLKVHQGVNRMALGVVKEWMSRLVAPHPTSYSSHPPTILPIPAICRTFPLGSGSKGWVSRPPPPCPPRPHTRLSYPTLSAEGLTAPSASSLTVWRCKGGPDLL